MEGAGSEAGVGRKHEGFGLDGLCGLVLCEFSVVLSLGGLS